MSKTVGIAMSGGIDSTYAAILLKESGYNVVGFTFHIANIETKSSDGSSNIIDNERVAHVANQIGIPHHTIDLSKPFQHLVIDSYREGYMKGITPNPCAICNQVIKWGILRGIMFEHDCEFIATGHYARIVKRDDGFVLKCAKDINKDQSYFLYFLDQHLMEKTILPLGELTKENVRNKLSDADIDIQAKSESQDLCFIGAKSDRITLFEDLKKGIGDIVDTSGKLIGKHPGLEKYTVGQRKGLDIAHSERLYVLSKNAQENKLIVGEKEDLFQSEMSVHNFIATNPSCPEPNSPEFKCQVKIRYRTPTADALLTRQSETDVHLKFDNPVKGIAPGQVAVAYIDDEVVGGGIISAD